MRKKLRINRLVIGCRFRIVHHCTLHEPLNAEVHTHNRTAHHGTLAKITCFAFTHTIPGNIAKFSHLCKILKEVSIIATITQDRCDNLAVL